MTDRSAGRTALVLPVPEAVRLAEDPYVALLDPFLAPGQVDDGVLRELRDFFAALVPFAFVLGEPTRFPGGATYLPPEPAGVFRRITHELRREFPEVVGTTTTLDTFVPHLAVPEGTGATRVEGHAREVQLRLLDDSGSRVLATFGFGTSAA